MDGSLPLPGEALHDEGRGHADAGGFVVAPCVAERLRGHPSTPMACLGGERTRRYSRGLRREPHRVYLMAPAQWKSTISSARNRTIDWATVIPAAIPAEATPTGRLHLPAVSVSAPTKTPPATAWLLPPAWPLDGWSTPTVADLRRVADTRVLSRLQAQMNFCLAWARRSRYRFAASIAVSVIIGVILVSLRIHASTADARPVSASASTVAPAAPAAVLPPSTPGPARVRPVAEPVSASSPVALSSEPSSPAESDRRLLLDASAMDLMMPIEEPDLDIGSRQSLWSQVGKVYGVDPLLLYSVALVESKALYPDGKVAPTPWLFRVNDHLVRGERHDVQLAMAAASQFGSAVQDVGIMQVYYPMHRDAVRDPLTLLNPRTNITVAAKILRDGMHQTRDRVLGVGYYHSHTPSLARDYGTAVLTVYERLKTMRRPTARVPVMAR
ncbi:MAG TPA: hypothetical protein VGC19_15300 [Rhodanobacter sp.]